jgi:PTH1 family peptidyl-tRNA hydrolase
MKIVIGLGNPGLEYSNTRHNAGQMLVEKIAQIKAELTSYGWRRRNNIDVWESPGLVLVKSAGIFMNESGRMIRELLDKYQITQGGLYAAHDDLDIRLGEYKVQFGKGPKEHGGVNSVISALASEEFWRIRLGIENRDRDREAGESYVLKKFSSDELGILDKVLEKATHEITETNN